jgi:ferric-dicitrate binding protein FerR (iron transport regulator)
MTEYNWELIAKHLAKETNSEEKELVSKLLAEDAEFSKEYSAAKKLWKTISVPVNNYNKDKVYQLIEEQISKSEVRNRFKEVLKYAAIFIAAVMLIGGVASDLNRTKVLTAGNDKVKTFNLPDGSIVHLRNGATAEYSDSRLLSFNRKIHLINGEGFFEIAKDDGKKFIVKTIDYNITVLGTKFDVNCSKEKTDVVLAEGKILLNNFDKSDYDNITLAPGDMVSYHKDGIKPEIKHVNPNIYNMWMENKMEFKQFSINEIAEVFKIQFNKTVIIKDKKIGEKRIGGSAPSDDFNLILKGLSDVLHRNIIHRNDTIIIE